MRTLPILLLATGGCLAASEMRPVDLRLTLMLTPETEPVEASYVSSAGSGSSVTSDRLDIGYRVEAGLVTRIVELTPASAIVGGGWVFYGEQESGASGDLDLMVGPRSYLVFGIDLYIAWRVQFSHHVGMELGPVVGAGTTRFSDRMSTGSGSPPVEEVGHGEYEEAGMNLQFLIRNTSRSFLLALGVRYLVSRGEADNSFGDTVQEVEVRQHGFAPFLSLGTTF
jgi:hypothetical protein